MIKTIVVRSKYKVFQYWYYGSWKKPSIEEIKCLKDIKQKDEDI